MPSRRSDATQNFVIEQRSVSGFLFTSRILLIGLDSRRIAPMPVFKRPPAYLPRELIDKICGYLKHDKYSLAACTLLCHHWQPSARPCLFHSITIHHNVDAFREFLATESSLDVVQYVECFELSSTDRGYRREEIKISSFDLDFILSKLPALQNLTLQRITLQLNPYTSKQFVTSRPLERLTIHVKCILPQSDW